MDPKRGVAVVEAGNSKQLCGAAVDKQMAAWKKLLDEAHSLASDGEFPDVFECESLGDRTACAYHHPVGEDAFTFVFAPDASGKPVLAGFVADSSADEDARSVSLAACAAK